MSIKIIVFSFFVFLFAGMTDIIQAKPFHVDSIKVHFPGQQIEDAYTGFQHLHAVYPEFLKKSTIKELP